MTALKILLDEHQLLLHAIRTARNIQKISDDDAYHTQIRGIILFFRNFTEIYHHPKEDEILYPLLRRHASRISPEFLYEVGDNHDDFKILIADIENIYLFYNCNKLRHCTELYINALEKHILKEDEIVLSIAGSLLNADELELVQDAFQKFDEAIGYKDELIDDFLKIESLNAAV